MHSNTSNGTTFNLDLEGNEHNTQSNALVAIGGKLPNCFQVSTGKLLDVIVAFSPRYRSLDAKQGRQFRQTLRQKLYNKTRPGFYLEVGELLHLAYAGQPGGANTQHQWRIFCAGQLKPQIETLIAGTSLTVPETGSEQQNAETGASGNYTREWGGLYLRSEAEVRIAEALNRTGLLFFANVRGRVGLQGSVVSNDQLTGRVEADFMVFYQGKCMILEVDGQHHLEEGQSIRDYARDRVLLRAGVPTVRFTARDCLERPHEVVSEFSSILLCKA
ncbi:MAG: endonuclease domain-containing protein [Myxacorys chilensis ATA2-1-KO14]|jgi:very-short-patch-repair endonuclease|nr:endonuclease domain-containing protein [Myxacorys chilensis ATA2-1-KO14]